MIHGAPRGDSGGKGAGAFGVSDGAWGETLQIYGTDAEHILALAASNPEWGKLLHPRLPYIQAEVVWAAREELCMTVEDALSRRTRSLLLDARAAIECAPVVASLLAAELGRDEIWKTQQINFFRELAGNYLPDLPL
jgi:glycerol-3-phosphate dehydrogenase